MDTSSPTLRELLAFLGGLAVAIPSYVKIYRDWKTSDRADAKTEAETHLTNESAASIRLRDSIAAGESFGKMLVSLMEAGENLSAFQKRIFQLEQDNIELKMKREEIRRVKAFLVLKGIAYSEIDKLRLDTDNQQ